MEPNIDLGVLAQMVNSDAEGSKLIKLLDGQIERREREIEFLKLAKVKKVKHRWTSWCGRIELRLTQYHFEFGFRPGQDSEPYIQKMLKWPEIASQLGNLDPNAIASVLSEYGSWDDEQLQDHEENKLRLLWIACGDLYESQV